MDQFIKIGQCHKCGDSLTTDHNCTVVDDPLQRAITNFGFSGGTKNWTTLVNEIKKLEEENKSLIWQRDMWAKSYHKCAKELIAIKERS